METRELRIMYGRLIEFRETLRPIAERNVEKVYSEALIQTLEELKALEVQGVDSILSMDGIRALDPDFPYVSKSVMLLAVGQSIAILEYGYGLKDQVVEIGSLYNSIRDPQLHDRCADLLASDSKFDRVINQATLVLEDRIRKKVGGSDLTGTRLANQFIKSDATSSPIVFSPDGDEQKGYADLVRGVFLALRNGTHHQISDEFSREDAFAICAFIDRLLRLLEVASFRKDL